MTFLGGTGAFLWGLVQTWTGRANNAWGSSRVWNSGTSWESAYNSEVTAATDPGSSADSWTDHLSRLWSATANLWHGAYNSEVTAYNNALAPAAADQIIGTNISTGMNGGGVAPGNEIMRITVDRTGQWAFAGYVQLGTSGDGTTVTLTISSAGTQLGTNSFAFAPNVTGGSAGSGVFASPALLNSGAVVSLFGVKDGAQNDPTLAQQGFRGWFIPTQGNPH